MLRQNIIPNKPVLVIEGQKKYIIVTDLHIGFESALASNEIFLGRNTTINETIEELSEIINSENPDSVILLGDIKSSIKSISKTEWSDVPMFFDKIKSICNVIVIPGNHDAHIQKLVPNEISLIGSTGMIEENILFTHGHTMPSENFSNVDKIIMGHACDFFPCHDFQYAHGVIQVTGNDVSAGGTESASAQQVRRGVEVHRRSRRFCWRDNVPAVPRQGR